MVNHDADLDDDLDLDDELLDGEMDEQENLRSEMKGCANADIRRKIEERLELRRLRDELGMSDDYLDL